VPGGRRVEGRTARGGGRKVERLVLLAEAELNPLPGDGCVENLVLKNERSVGLDENTRSRFFDYLIVRVGTFDHRQTEGDLTLPGRLSLDAASAIIFTASAALLVSVSTGAHLLAIGFRGRGPRVAAA
jgi:hypothetical protein